MVGVQGHPKDMARLSPEWAASGPRALNRYCRVIATRSQFFTVGVP
jgi:hypothetical protein